MASFALLGCVAGEETEPSGEELEEAAQASEYVPDCTTAYIGTTTNANDDDCHYVCTVGAGFHHGQRSLYFPATCFCHTCQNQ